MVLAAACVRADPFGAMDGRIWTKAKTQRREGAMGQVFSPLAVQAILGSIEMFSSVGWHLFTPFLHTMRSRRDVLGLLVVIAGFAAYWVGSEIHYARSISPGGITAARDYFSRFGEPLFIQMVAHEGQNYYEFAGRLPPAFSMATPSSPPVYVFDELGRYVTWCRDPGDNPNHRRQWPLLASNRVEIGVVRQKFGL